MHYCRVNAVERLEDRSMLVAGALDLSFGGDGKVTTNIGFPGTSDIATAVVAFQPDGKMVAVGRSDGDFGIVRYNEDGSLDATFGNEGKLKIDFDSFDTATGVAVDSQGRIVVIGSSSQGTTGADFTVARLTSDGALDTSFDSDGKATIDFSSPRDGAEAVTIDSQDRIVVAGHSDRGGFNRAFAVARLTTAGALDSSFDLDGKQIIDFGGDDTGWSVALDSQERVLVGGQSFAAGTGSNFAVTRLTSAGALDGAFAADGKQLVDFGGFSELGRGIAVDAQDRVILAGHSLQFGTGWDFSVARLSTDGTLDSSFHVDGRQTIDLGTSDDFAQEVAVDSQGRIVFFGHARTTGGFYFAAARLTSAGELDTSFDSDGKQTVDFGGLGQGDIGLGGAVDALDRVVLVGHSNQGVNRDDFAIARLTSTGALDSSFDSDGKVTTDFLRRTFDEAFDVVAQQSDGKLVALGRIIDAGGDFAVTRYNVDGSLDTAFGTDGKVLIDFGNTADFGQTIAVDSQDRIVVAGDSNRGASLGIDFAVARLTSSGELDSSFDLDGRQLVDFGGSADRGWGVAVDSQDRIVLGGETNHAGSVNFAVARLLTNGTLDGSFDADGKQTVDFGSTDQEIGRSVAVDAQDRVVVAGDSFRIATGGDFAVARLTAAGALDGSFDADGKQLVDLGASTQFGSDVVLDSQGRIVVAGSSNQIGTGFDFAVLRLTSAGTLDESFNGDGKQTVDFGGTVGIGDRGYRVVVDSRDRIVVGGETRRAASTGADFAVVRLLSSGALDGSFDEDGKQTVDFGSTIQEAGRSVAVDSQDRIIVAGVSRQLATGPDFALARLLGNSPPVAGDASLVTNEDLAAAITLQANDPEGDPLTYVITLAPQHGALSGTGPNLTYTPNAGYAGADSFNFKASDGKLDSNEATVSITVRNLVDLSGCIFDDLANNGAFDEAHGDGGLPGVVVELVDELTANVVATATTDDQGAYGFQNIAEGTYTIRQQGQPAGFLDGLESTGSLGGAVISDDDSNAITGIVIGAPGTRDDTAGYDFAELRPASLQGLVWEDFNDDADVDMGERAIGNVAVELTGTDDRGQSVRLAQTTNIHGIYEFSDLRPGTYSVMELQPSGFIDGKESLGEVLEPPPAPVAGVDGVIDAVTADNFAGVQLVAGSYAVNYNFGERGDGGQLSTGQTAGIGFWQNKNGQALIQSLNGSASSTLLASWLAETFPNMYGGDALADTDADGDVDNLDVAYTYKTLFKRTGNDSPGGPRELDAQVLAVALASFITKESLAGLVYDAASSVEFRFNDANNDGLYSLADGDSAVIDPDVIANVESYGFLVTTGGVGSKTFNVGDSGAAFGVADNTDVLVIDLLLATDRMSLSGLLYDDSDSNGLGDGSIDEFEALLRVLANDVYSTINEYGDQ